MKGRAGQGTGNTHTHTHTHSWKDPKMEEQLMYTHPFYLNVSISITK